MEWVANQRRLVLPEVVVVGVTAGVDSFIISCRATSIKP